MVVVIDDEPSVRKSLGRLLRAAGYRVEVLSSAREFLGRAWNEEIGCLVLDVRMPELDGLELQELLTRGRTPPPIVFITGHGSIPMSVRAMKAGATDFLSKPFDSNELLRAIEMGVGRAGDESKERAAASAARNLLTTLTPREHEVLLHVLAGEMNKQTASAIGTTEKTIKVHRSRVMQKMGVRSVADLVRLCERAGIRLP